MGTEKIKTEMMKIEDIKTGDNPRTDMGDLTELCESIKINGIIEPLVVNQNNQLIAGGRRLEAARFLNLETVPVIIRQTESEEEDAELRLIENIQRKDLNIVEEGCAFKEYMDNSGHNEEYLAHKIGKSKKYVENRLLAASLSDDVKDALLAGKIKPGHAIIISKADESDHKKLLSKAKKMSVSEFADNFRHVWDDVSLDLDRAFFDKKECKTCIHNGGEQSILTEIGSELKSTCLSRKCFIQKCKDGLKQKIDDYKEKNIKVLSEKEAGKIKNKVVIRSWDDVYEKARNELPGSEDYALVVYFDDSLSLHEDVVCLNPKILEKPKAKKQSKSKGKSSHGASDLENCDDDIDSKQEKTKEKEAKERLLNKVSDYKRKLLLDTITDKITPHEKKAMCLYALLDASAESRNQYFKNIVNDIIKQVSRTNGYVEEISIEKIIELEDKTINEYIEKVSISWTQMLSDKNIVSLANDAEISWEQDFELTEEFLNLYTKEQLTKLAKELKIKDIDGNLSKPEIVQDILKKATSKVVPKILGSNLSI